MKKRKSPIFKIIKNEQTPKTNLIKNPKEWIEKNKNILNGFKIFSKKQNKAVGLASNQVAHLGKRLDKRFFAIVNGLNKPFRIVINPQITKYDGDPSECEEGCLTWPGKVIIAKRFPKITVSYWTEDGEYIENEILKDFTAQVWQHEINHLDGKEEKVIKRNIVNEKLKKVVGRNDPCPCGSGKKYKKCCL